jgi:hypothetical protein
MIEEDDDAASDALKDEKRENVPLTPDCQIILSENERLFCYQYVLARHSPVLKANIESSFVERDPANNNVLIRAIDRLNIPHRSDNADKDLR